MKERSLLVYYNFSRLNNQIWNFVVSYVLENETGVDLELPIFIFHSLLWTVDLSSTSLLVSLIPNICLRTEIWSSRVSKNIVARI